MNSFIRAATALTIFSSVAYGQGVITSAKGDTGTSYAMQVDINNYADADYINQAEIVANAVNACGRTLLAGDISEAGVTEELLETGNYTTVSQGSTITMIISQRYANGSGPFTCDLDEASNALGAYGQTNLTVAQDSSEYGTGDLTLTITMPTDLKCIGASTGNMCTVRCVNSFSFGGCITVQQTDVTANVNTVDNIVTAEKKAAVAAQVVQNQKDLAAAEKGLAAASTTEEEALSAVKAILAEDTTIDEDTEADAVTTTAATATATTATTAAATTTAGTGTKKSGTKTRTKTGTVSAKTGAATTRTRTRTGTASNRTRTGTGTVTAKTDAASTRTRTRTRTRTGTKKTASTASTAITTTATTTTTSAAKVKRDSQLRWAVRRFADESEE